MENKNLENGWKKVLDGAEVPPNDAIWSSIESDLLAAENRSMRKTIVLYRRMAAALLLFAFVVGAFSIYYGNQHSEEVTNDEDKISQQEHSPLAAQATDKKHQLITSLDKNSVNPNKEVLIAQNEISAQRDDANDKTDQEELNYGVPKASSTPDKINNDVNEKKRKLVESIVTENSKSQPLKILAPPLSSSENINERGKRSGEQTIALLDTVLQHVIANDTTALSVIAKNDSDQQIMPIVEKKLKETMWFSVGGSEGNYNPGLKALQPTASVAPTYFSSGVSTPKRGTFYCIGFSFGRKIFSRWVVQGGVSYLNQSYSYTSYYQTANYSSLSAANSYSLKGGNSINSVPSVSATRGISNVTNTSQFISVPIQIGYLAINQKVSVLLNTGASPNIFIRNSFRYPSGNLKSYSEGPGSNSPYKNISWYGLLNAEFSYGLWGRFRCSIVPGIRYAMGSSLKSGNDRPSVLDLGFRLRYTIR